MFLSVTRRQWRPRRGLGWGAGTPAFHTAVEQTNLEEYARHWAQTGQVQGFVSWGLRYVTVWKSVSPSLGFFMCETGIITFTIHNYYLWRGWHSSWHLVRTQLIRTITAHYIQILNWPNLDTTAGVYFWLTKGRGLLENSANGSVRKQFSSTWKMSSCYTDVTKSVCWTYVLVRTALKVKVNVALICILFYLWKGLLPHLLLMKLFQYLK